MIVGIDLGGSGSAPGGQSAILTVQLWLALPLLAFIMICALWSFSSDDFLGFGAAPPAAEWGTLIANGRHFLITAPWVSLLPGLFVVAVVFSLNHLARSAEEHAR